jgi:hypothetical protein
MDKYDDSLFTSGILAQFIASAGYKALMMLTKELRSSEMIIDGDFNNTTADKLGLKGTESCRTGEMYLNACRSGRLLIFQRNLGNGSIEETSCTQDLNTTTSCTLRYSTLRE